jgi:glycosyltransferase involved in cell wall biosynthesis
MLKIVVETIWTQPPFQFGGIFEYTIRLLREFERASHSEALEIFELRGPKAAPQFAELTDSETYHVVPAPGMGQRPFWRLFGSHFQARHCDPDVLFCPNPDVLVYRSIPTVTMIHDVTFRKVRQFSGLQTWQRYMFMKQVARSSTFIITNSECSKRDIVHELGVDSSRVVVTYLAHDRDRYNLEPVSREDWDQVAQKYNLDKPFILHVGMLQPRKNLVRMIAAYRRMIRSHPELNIDLVLAGGFGWNFEPILEAATSTGRQGHVIITGKMEDSELPILVKNAALSIIPSLYEGFSFPMLESMACGVPTIVSNNSCFQEVSGNVLRYFNAESVEEIARTMYDVLQSPDEQNRLRKVGIERAESFSWDRCARETLEVLRAAANTRG